MEQRDLHLLILNGLSNRRSQSERIEVVCCSHIVPLGIHVLYPVFEPRGTIV